MFLVPLTYFLMSYLFAYPPAQEMDYSFNPPYVNNFLNFGVLEQSDTYTWYRSSKMNHFRLNLLYSHLSDYDLPEPKTVIYMNKNGYGGAKSFFMVDAISEYEDSFEYGFDFFHSYYYPYRTYLDGYNPYEASDDIDNKFNLSRWARSEFEFEEDDLIDGDVDAFIRIMELVLDPDRQPILFHCYGGRHRTGMVAMMLRYLQGGAWVEGKKVTMKVNGLIYHLNPAEYEYYRHNTLFMRHENIDFVRTFSATEPIFKKWKKIYQESL